MSNIFCSVQNAASILGIGRTFTYKLINEGHLEVVKLGRRTLIKVESIKAFTERATGGAK